MILGRSASPPSSERDVLAPSPAAAPSFFGALGLAVLGAFGSAGAAGVVDAAGGAVGVEAAGVAADAEAAGIAAGAEAAGVGDAAGVAGASGLGLDCSSSAILQMRFKLCRP